MNSKTINFKSPTVNMFVLDVTPTLAVQMLATSPGNRAIRHWYIDMMACAQQRGEWRLTHQGPAFDVTGALRDGHHRLMACVQSGVTISMPVTVGLQPEVFDAVDRGINRTLVDLTGWDKRVAEPLRLATEIVRAVSRVTPQQVKDIAAGGLADAIAGVIEHCGTSRRYYASSAMRLAAAISIMSGTNSKFVLRQYRALCLLDFDEMTPLAKALVRQVDSSKVSSSNTRETLTRGMRVFDSGRASLSRVQVTAADVAETIKMMRALLLDSIGEVRYVESNRSKHHQVQPSNQNSRTNHMEIAA